MPAKVESSAPAPDIAMSPPATNVNDPLATLRAMFGCGAGFFFAAVVVVVVAAGAAPLRAQETTIVVRSATAAKPSTASAYLFATATTVPSRPFRRPVTWRHRGTIAEGGRVPENRQFAGRSNR